MASRSLRVELIVLTLGLFLVVPSVPMPTDAGELTDVVDAFDEDDPFDFHIEPSFRQEINSGVVIREAPCTPNPDGPPDAFANASRCLDGPALIYNKELEYQTVLNALDLDIQFGLWHDLEFHLSIPIIFSFSRDVSFASGVDETNSSIAPSDPRITSDLADGGEFSTYSYFDVAEVGNGPTRSGFGDMMLGIAWSPFNQERNRHLATLTLGFDYIAPTGEVATRYNDAVGRGVHELQFYLAASRLFSFIEPYFGILYALPIPTSNSLFQDYGGGQIFVGPGQRAEIEAGAEFILYDNPARDQHFTLDVGLIFTYQAEGRDYSPLFDAFGASHCNGNTPNLADFDTGSRLYQPDPSTDPDAAACAWILQAPANLQRTPALPEDDQAYVFDGITTIEAYAVLGAQVGLNFQISEYVEIRFMSRFATQTEHFLTTARTGVDEDDDGEVDFDNPNERNPVYNPTLDGVGRRLKVESVFDFGWSGTLAFQF